MVTKRKHFLSIIFQKKMTQLRSGPYLGKGKGPRTTWLLKHYPGF